MRGTCTTPNLSTVSLTGQQWNESGNDKIWGLVVETKAGFHLSASLRYGLDGMADGKLRNASLHGMI